MSSQIQLDAMQEEHDDKEEHVYKSEEEFVKNIGEDAQVAHYEKFTEKGRSKENNIINKVFDEEQEEDKDNANNGGDDEDMNDDRSSHTTFSAHDLCIVNQSDDDNVVYSIEENINNCNHYAYCLVNSVQDIPHVDGQDTSEQKEGKAGNSKVKDKLDGNDRETEQVLEGEKGKKDYWYEKQLKQINEKHVEVVLVEPTINVNEQDEEEKNGRMHRSIWETSEATMTTNIIGRDNNDKPSNSNNEKEEQNRKPLWRRKGEVLIAPTPSPQRTDDEELATVITQEECKNVVEVSLKEDDEVVKNETEERQDIELNAINDLEYVHRICKLIGEALNVPLYITVQESTLWALIVSDERRERLAISEKEVQAVVEKNERQRILHITEMALLIEDEVCKRAEEVAALEKLEITKLHHLFSVGLAALIHQRDLLRAKWSSRQRAELIKCVNALRWEWEQAQMEIQVDEAQERAALYDVAQNIETHLLELIEKAASAAAAKELYNVKVDTHSLRPADCYVSIKDNQVNKKMVLNDLHYAHCDESESEQREHLLEKENEMEEEEEAEEYYSEYVEEEEEEEKPEHGKEEWQLQQLEEEQEQLEELEEEEEESEVDEDEWNTESATEHAFFEWNPTNNTSSCSESQKTSAVKSNSCTDNSVIYNIDSSDGKDAANKKHGSVYGNSHTVKTKKVISHFAQVASSTTSSPSIKINITSDSVTGSNNTSSNGNNNSSHYDISENNVCDNTKEYSNQWPKEKTESDRSSTVRVSDVMETNCNNKFHRKAQHHITFTDNPAKIILVKPQNMFKVNVEEEKLADANMSNELEQITLNNNKQESDNVNKNINLVNATHDKPNINYNDNSVDSKNDINMMCINNKELLNVSKDDNKMNSEIFTIANDDVVEQDVSVNTKNYVGDIENNIHITNHTPNGNLQTVSVLPFNRHIIPCSLCATCCPTTGTGEKAYREFVHTYVCNIKSNKSSNNNNNRKFNQNKHAQHHKTHTTQNNNLNNKQKYSDCYNYIYSANKNNIIEYKPHYCAPTRTWAVQVQEAELERTLAELQKVKEEVKREKVLTNYSEHENSFPSHNNNNVINTFDHCKDYNKNDSSREKNLNVCDGEDRIKIDKREIVKNCKYKEKEEYNEQNATAKQSIIAAHKKYTNYITPSHSPCVHQSSNAYVEELYRQSPLMLRQRCLALSTINWKDNLHHYNNKSDINNNNNTHYNTSSTRCSRKQSHDEHHNESIKFNTHKKYINNEQQQEYEHLIAISASLPVNKLRTEHDTETGSPCNMYEEKKVKLPSQQHQEQLQNNLSEADYHYDTLYFTPHKVLPKRVQTSSETSSSSHKESELRQQPKHKLTSTSHSSAHSLTTSSSPTSSSSSSSSPISVLSIHSRSSASYQPCVEQWGSTSHREYGVCSPYLLSEIDVSGSNANNKAESLEETILQNANSNNNNNKIIDESCDSVNSNSNSDNYTNSKSQNNKSNSNDLNWCTPQQYERTTAIRSLVYEKEEEKEYQYELSEPTQQEKQKELLSKKHLERLLY